MAAIAPWNIDCTVVDRAGWGGRGGRPMVKEGVSSSITQLVRYSGWEVRQFLNPWKIRRFIVPLEKGEALCYYYN